MYKNSQVTRKTKSIKECANEVYMFDNCIANLEFDLEKIHKSLHYNYNKKVIYVIDELDKLESDDKKSKKVDNILNYFKNFFSLSNAIFVFIGGEKLYDGIILNNKSTNKMDELVRPKNYTYFTSKYFISRPQWPDLDSYFNDIIQDEKLDSEKIKIFKRALCFEAMNDFFDLKKFINSRITSIDPNERPVIDFVESDEDINKARFHKAITILYEGKYASKKAVDWRENEKLINRLFQHANYVSENNSQDPIKDPEDDSLASQLQRDFNSFMEFLGAFQISEENQKKINGLNVFVRTYRYIGSVPMEPPSHLTEATEFEKRYIYKFTLYMDYAKAIVSSFMTAKGVDKESIDSQIDNPQQLFRESQILGINIERIYDNNYLIYDKINKKKELFVYRRDDIEKKIKDIENQTDNLLNRLPEILAKMISSLNPKNDLSVIHNKIDDTIFNIIPKEFRRNFSRSLVIIDKESSQQILFTNINKHFLCEMEKEIEINSSTHRVVYITKVKEAGLKNTSTILINNPKNLEDTIIPFLIETERFLSNSKKMNNGTNPP